MHVRDYIEHLKRKPEHIRRRIALGSTAGVTALVFAGWLTALLTSDALALTPQNPAMSAEIAEANRQTSQGFSELLGAASAFQSGTTQTEEGLMIVDGEQSSTVSAPAEDTRTVIPF